VHNEISLAMNKLQNVHEFQTHSHKRNLEMSDKQKFYNFKSNDTTFPKKNDKSVIDDEFYSCVTNNVLKT